MKSKAFTLIEILIVVILLGILAAIIIPQFGSSSDDARLSAAKTDLATVRTQLQLYRVQHSNVFPTAWNQMTLYTDQSGATATSADATHVYGPYLPTNPTNQFNNLATVTVGTGTNPKDNSSGWYYNSTTGVFQANCTNSVGSVVVGNL